MSETVLTHLMRTYCILFLLFGLGILALPNMIMDILGLPHIEGYFWKINVFSYLVFMALLSFRASKNHDLIKYITFVKFFSAIIFLIYSLALLSLGLLLSGLFDLALGLGIVISQKL